MDFAMHSGKNKGSGSRARPGLVCKCQRVLGSPGKCEGMTGLVEMEALLRFIKPQVLEKRIEKETRTL